MTGIRWTREDMIAATIEHWGDESIAAKDCKVIVDASGEQPCLIVVHRPTGRTSAEAGDAGRWHCDGSAYEVS